MMSVWLKLKQNGLNVYFWIHTFANDVYIPLIYNQVTCCITASSIDSKYAYSVGDFMTAFKIMFCYMLLA